MKYEVYRVLDLTNQKSYIGATFKDYQKRFRAHLAKTKYGSMKLFHQAIRQNGEENFQLSLLEVCISEEHMMEREKYWIKVFDSMNPDKGYNMTSGGIGAPNKVYTEDTKNKIGKAASKPLTVTNEVSGVRLSFDKAKDAADFFGLTYPWFNTIRRRAELRGVPCKVNDWDISPRTRRILVNPNYFAGMR